MRLGLTNTIAARGTPVGGDGLALDLQFAADKTLTARKGPTPVFTRASSGTFVGSNGLIQSAGNNVARFDHDPVTLASRGLLIEESRTNLSLRSGAIVFGSGWFIDNATSTSSGTGPDGNSSYLIAESTGTGVHTILNTGGLTQSGATSVTSGTVYTGSIFLKKVTGSVDWIQVTFGSGGFGTTAYANFNIGNGTAGNSAGLASGTSPRIEDYGNGWYRCSISVAATATISTSSNVIVGFIQNTNGTTRLPVYAGSTSNQFLAAMCQFEAGSFATSYIPTTTASVVRSADVCSIAAGPFATFYNPAGGTLAATQTVNTISTLSTPEVCRIVGSVGQFQFGTTNLTNEALRFFSIGSVTRSLRTGTRASGVQFKTAMAFANNDLAACLDNGSVLTDTTTQNIPIGVSMTIGVNAACMHIARLQYFKKRLSNAKLQALTV